MRVPQDFPLRTKLVLQHSSAVNGLGAKAVNRWILLPHHFTPSAVVLQFGSEFALAIAHHTEA